MIKLKNIMIANLGEIFRRKCKGLCDQSDANQEEVIDIHINAGANLEED